jgi:Raf kinase inhibitor-like YbhB/YbcL family protein
MSNGLRLSRVLWVVLPAVAVSALIGCQERTTVSETPSGVEVDVAPTAGWSLTSRAFDDGERIPQRYTGDGDDVSPELTWSDPPEGTVEFALICDDPDAPAGTWTHWVLYGVAPDRRSLPEALPTPSALPELDDARQGRNSWGDTGYRGPAPPRGPDHHYRFRLYALDAPVDLAPGATADALRSAMAGHVVGQTELVGLYSR